MQELQRLFKIKTGKTVEPITSVFSTLPDFDFDCPSAAKVMFGTRLSLSNGKPHPVARSVNELPWSLTKHSCDRLGIAHVDVLPNTSLDELSKLTVEQLEESNCLNHLYKEHDKELYHIHRNMKYIFARPPITSIEDLAKFIGSIRPHVCDLFLKNQTTLPFNHSKLRQYCKDHQIIFQEDIIRCLQIVYDYDWESAEARRVKSKSLYLPVDDPDTFTTESDRKLFERIYDVLNPQVLSKGHCLQVAYIIMLQLYDRYMK